MSCPRSAIAAISSAATGLLDVFGIRSPFLFRCFPQSYKVVELAVGILSDFMDHAVQRAAHPPDGTELLGIIGAPVGDVFRAKECLHFLKANAPLGIRFEPLAFLGIKLEALCVTVIP